MLTPNFEAMPPELRALPRWVLWKGAKVPYCAEARDSKASPTNPDTWASFPATQTAFEEGGYSGVGFVLNGDGIVGVDLDKCAPNGKPSSEALALLDRIGCQYIELSPSGNGLHGFGLCPGEPIKGRRGMLGGLRVELYSSARYLTVTGHPLQIGPLMPLTAFAEVANLLGKPSPTEDTEATEDFVSNLPCSSVSSVGIPAWCLPAREGERHQCLFELARFIKGTRPDATRAELRTIAQEWHRMALPVIGTKDFTITWADFQRGWHRVEYPYGATLNSIIGAIDFTAPLPLGIEALGYGPAGHRLVQICVGLQAHFGEHPFFLSSRQAGALIGIYFTDAAKVLAALCADGVLQLVEKGAGVRASRYRYVWTGSPPGTEMGAHRAERSD